MTLTAGRESVAKIVLGTARRMTSYELWLFAARMAPRYLAGQAGLNLMMRSGMAANVRLPLRRSPRWILLALLLRPVFGAAPAAANVTEIVQRSVQNSNANWAAAPQYSFTETDVTTKGGKSTRKTYEVVMLEGSPYNKLIASDGHQLSPDELSQQEKKFQQELEHRRNETPEEREKRLDQYRNERRQDHALMQDMVKAFNFRLLRQETINGRLCFVLGATPRPGYQPTSRDTKVLTGMRGTMWVDTQQYQWVKVEAEVFRPVEFGLFIARVQPGTEFTLEQMPVEANIWLPSHFSQRVRAKILIFSRRSEEVQTFSNYHRQSSPPARQSAK